MKIPGFLYVVISPLMLIILALRELCKRGDRK